jgi:PAS domain S-box-containing protein
MQNHVSSVTVHEPSKASILLVDDQPANLLALEAVLDDLGHNLVKALSGEQALQVLLTQDFAVVLLDVRMRGLDGFDTARRIRSEERSRYTPIIFLTGFDENRLDVERAYALGAVDYLVKPFVPVILRAKVSQFVELFNKTEQIKLQAEQLRRMDRRQFEQQLQDENARLQISEKRFARFMHYLPGLAWIKDPQGRYVFANEAALKVFRTSRMDQPIGKTDDELFPPETAAQFKANDQQALASGAGVQVIEALKQGDGVVHYSLVSKFPIPGPDESQVLVGGMAIDVTEHRNAEDRLREESRRKDEFLAMLAHELRNPLAPIRNAAQVCKLLASADANLQRASGMIERQVEQLTRIVDDLLDVSRISSGKVKFDKEALELAPVIGRAVETSRPLMDARGQELTVTLPAEPVMIEGDKARLAQVVANLLNNATKYTQERGHIWLIVERTPGQAVIRVRDNGMGIPADLLPRVFDLFTQGDRSLARSEGGLGIGLTLARRLIEMQGGTVDAYSEGPGQGSEFVVRLPLLERRHGRREVQAEAEAGCLLPIPRRVLVVDDNVDAAESLAMVLRVDGHEVRTVHDGQVALQAAHEFRPEVVLLDIGLPRISGYDVARQLRQHDDLKMALLVAVTGYGHEEDRRQAMQAGFDAHLTKPADTGALRQLLAFGARLS